MISARVLVVAALAAATWAQVAHAEEATGSVTGHVYAKDHSPLAGVDVKVHSEGGDVDAGFAVTGADGSFTIGNLPAGTYEIVAREANGTSSVASGVAIRPGEATTSDVVLETPPPVPPAVATPGETSTSTGVPLEVKAKTPWQGPSEAEEPEEPEPYSHLDTYGFAMLDLGYEFGRSDPDWFDVARPTKLPADVSQFGQNGHFYAGVRQSRFGVKGFLPTDTVLGEVKTIFEFEMFGVGVDAGQTTFRLRHAWGEMNQIGAGQTWSVFMDPDIFPNSIEYWGPNGMVLFRNVQLRWSPIKNDMLDIAFSAERPGATADAGTAADRIDLSRVTARFPLPDFAAHVRVGGEWGHVQVAGIIRYINWDDNNTSSIANVSGSAVGWGADLSTNIKLWKDTLRVAGVIGQGIENYLNDANVDVGAKNNSSDINRPLLGVPLLSMSGVAFLDHTWSDEVTSTLGYSIVEIFNSDGQAPDAFQAGQYALVNMLFKPVPNVMFGPEFQWVWRRNKSNGFYANDFRIQASFKYSFDYEIRGKE
jgi:hypothetical protein